MTLIKYKGSDLFVRDKGKLPRKIQSEANDGYRPYLTMAYLKREAVNYAQTYGSLDAEMDDILVVADGSGSGHIYTGHSGIVASTFFRLRATQIVLPKFLYYLLANDDLSQPLYRKGAAIPHFDISKIMEKSYLVPEKSIQQKIVDILSNTDTVIEKTDQIIQKSEELKIGLMSELLTKGIGHIKFQKMRIGEIPEEWNISPLSDICHRITDGKHGDCKNDDKSGYFFISSKDIRNNSINYDQARQITKVDFEDADKRTRLEAGDVVMTNSGTIGRMAIASEDPRTRKTTFQKSVAIIKPELDVIIPRFLMYYFQSAIESLTVSSNGSAQKNLLLKDMRSFLVPVPPTKEQTKIVQILETIDNKIENESKTKEKLVVEKNGIMQNIFNQQYK